MKIGFTGTRHGMTALQAFAFDKILRDKEPDEVHHGDCKGADEEASAIARDRYEPYTTVIHPPTDPKLRAFCMGEVFREPKPYLERNKDIVDETDLLVACPRMMKAEAHSGTWNTIKYASKKGKPIIIIWPDGDAQYVQT